MYYDTCPTSSEDCKFCIIVILCSFIAGISSIEVSLLSVSGNDLNSQHVEVNCFTFRVKPYEVTWSIDSELITSNSNYLQTNGSELLDENNQTYRQYISLERAFSKRTMISCSTDVNGETEFAEYMLKGITIELKSFF